tara:strand:- start:163 stop:906 length:744 start_codon:yes stop_codon:yes gene_type:complete
MILISPAKRLQTELFNSSLDSTKPLFTKEADLIASELSKLDVLGLKSLMNVSDDIAEINVERYKNWNKPQQQEKRAIFLFEGDVFKNLNAKGMSEKDLNYMSEKLRILSGIYGILRPSDEINPYRLEMGTNFSVNAASNLYEFWGDKVANSIKSDFPSENIFNLASEEYFSVVKKYLDPKKVIEFKFLSMSGGKERVIGVIAKRARGEMAKFLIQNRIDDLEDIKKFEGLGFKLRNFEDNTFFFSNS